MPTSEEHINQAQLPKGLQVVMQCVNNFLHLPVVYELTWYLQYGVLLLLSPLLLPLLLLGLLYDLVTLRLFSFRMMEPQGRAVLITGCDTGFGPEIAKALAKMNWKVYAGCLQASSVEGLKGVAPGLLVPLLLDVTQQPQIDEAMRRIAEENPRGLYALVNNAGVGPGGVIDWAPMSLFRFAMEVNYFGTVAMCKSALPLLKQSAREGRGARIINITSIAGVYSGAYLLAAYAASKHACEAFSRTLASELIPFGVSVHVLNPTFHATAMANSGAQVRRLYQDMPAEKQAEYGPGYFEEVMRITDECQAIPWDTGNVTRALLQAVAGRAPKTQYILGMDGLFVIGPMLMAPVFVQRLVTGVVTRWHRLKGVLPTPNLTNGRAPMVVKNGRKLKD